MPVEQILKLNMDHLRTLGMVLSMTVDSLAQGDWIDDEKKNLGREQLLTSVRQLQANVDLQCPVMQSHYRARGSEEGEVLVVDKLHMTSETQRTLVEALELALIAAGLKHRDLPTFDKEQLASLRARIRKTLRDLQAF